MKIGSLFSGGGLGDLGFVAAGFDVAWQCEIDPFCQKVLALRYPDSKKYTDIRNLKGDQLEKVDIITGGFPCQPFSVAGRQKGKDDNRYLWPEMLRVLTETRPTWIVGENVAGLINMAQFDCEPEMDGEGNASGDIGDVFRRRGRGILDEILGSLEQIGYEAWPIVFPAHSLGAWHKRDRIWILAHARCEHGAGQAQSGKPKAKTGSRDASKHQRPDQCDRARTTIDPAGDGWSVADKNTKGLDRGSDLREGKKGSIETGQSSGSGCGHGGHTPLANARLLRQKKHEVKAEGTIKHGEGIPDPNVIDAQGYRSHDEERWAEQGERSPRLCGSIRWRQYWGSEPAVGRVAHGIANRVDRLKLLGNGQVPACTYIIAQTIMEVENGTL